jgi:lysozyme
MNYSKSGLQLTERFEGCKLSAYQDSKGVWTIGYGHTLGVKPGMTVTQGDAELWLQVDVKIAERTVNRLVRVTLTQPEFDALVDFEFNTGHLMGSTLLRLLNAGDFAGAAAQFERWDHAGGVELAGLLRRRQAEAEEFCDVAN